MRGQALDFGSTNILVQVTSEDEEAFKNPFLVENSSHKSFIHLGDVSPYSKVVLMLNEASQYTWQFQFYLQTIVDLVLWLSNPSLSWLVFYNWFLGSYEEGFQFLKFNRADKRKGY